MPINTTDIHDVADFLADSGLACEAYIRAAVSRYYYAAFMTAKSLEPKIQTRQAVFDIGVHMRVINKFITYAGAEKALVIKIGNELKRLKQIRNRADYELDDTLSAKTLTESKARAAQIIKWCMTAQSALPYG